MKTRLSWPLMLEHSTNVAAIVLIVLCFIFSMLSVQKYARADCFTRIEEVAVQSAEMFKHSMDENREKLEVMADILADNSSNPDEQLITQMEKFCQTQYYTSLCIHRANGSHISWGEHPHRYIDVSAFESEIGLLPYTSRVFTEGELPEQRYFYQAVPIIRDGETVALLFGYIRLDTLPELVSSTAYDGQVELYIADGDTGDFIMDEHHGSLKNAYDGSLGEMEVRDGYDREDMHEGLRLGRSGYYIFRSPSSGEWLYSYYMPIGINNWALILTLEEDIAFKSYNNVNTVFMVLGTLVIMLLLLHLLALYIQNRRRNQLDQAQLRRSAYINEIQTSLINAHNNPMYIWRALKTIADETGADTVLLLTFSGFNVNDIHYWPSRNKYMSRLFIGRNIQEDFPAFYDKLVNNESVLYTGQESFGLSPEAEKLITGTNAKNILVSPINDTSGNLRATVCAVNLADAGKVDKSALECITPLLFMAIANVENHSTIKRMGTMDMLTNTKNRNCYEQETNALAASKCEKLWCTFIDVNGLHTVNNTQGHKAGDLMLCTVANTMKYVFDRQYIYRTGGDEFLAFSFDLSEEELLEKKERITRELALKSYYISMGYAPGTRGPDGSFDIEQMVLDAEKHMYREKAEFYDNYNGEAFIPPERRLRSYAPGPGAFTARDEGGYSLR